MKAFRSVSCLLATCLLFAAFIVSCQKDDNQTLSSADKEEFANAASESDAQAEVVYNDIFDNVIGVNAEVGLGGTGIFGGVRLPFNRDQEIRSEVAGTDTTHCFVLTVTPLESGAIFPLQVTIDFGGGCTARDGNTRKGKIITVYSDRLIMPGATATTTFDGYYRNDVKVEGTHQIINKSTADSRVFQVLVDGKLTNSLGNTSEWKSDKTISQVEGLGTPFVPGDDLFEVTGQASGSVMKGDKLFQWEADITQPLRKSFECHWISKGVLELQHNDQAVASLDYGTGDCDNKATLTVNGQSRIISLH